MNRLILFVATSLFWGIMGHSILEATAQEIPSRKGIDSIRLNEIQVIGSHNSYKEAIEPALFKLLSMQDSSRILGLEYEHISLSEQLNLGLRKLELDIFYDPEGGRYTEPYGLRMVNDLGMDPLPFDEHGEMDEPGFKVLHVQDIDFRSNCLTLKSCLGELKTWSMTNPGHVPVFITVNAKDSPLPVEESVKPLAFSREAFESLDQELIEYLGTERLFTPDDLRGEYSTIQEALMKNGWPYLQDVLGTFIFVLDERGEKRATYIEEHPALEGRVMFVNAIEGTPEAAVRIVNNPVDNQEYIRQLVRSGYIVRTRSDANTREARTGDVARREAAFESGAQIISTDYYMLPNLFGTSYVVEFSTPLEARCNPLLGVKGCEDDYFLLQKNQ